jgi:peptidoglycan biosynthesis protein MviN/MurJ (putative lipid II flippase)
MLAAPGIDREDWRQMRPLLLGGSLYKTGPVVDRFWSSHAPAGAVGVYHLAHSAMTAAATLLDRSLCAPVLPGIARAVSAGRFDAVRHMLLHATARILAASLVFLLAWLALRGPAELAFRSLFGAGDAQASQAWLAVLWLMPMLPAAGIGSVLVSVHYALGDTRTPAVVSSIAFIAGIAVKALAFLQFGLPGLALGTSLFYVGNVVAVIVVLRRRLAGGLQ